ncbi:atp-dependent dna helicase [Moniliophthora roreri MCA 2997]|uniref:Atp-dependent dna helicase n=1 Tax=Moniliophthora roreri (strain MCA 2997) TaxID=1381753 RepID=V2WJP4_MONRO|nr:atp-dependent dna helicase [Moniliophthora roreri MCA 2997]
MNQILHLQPTTQSFIHSNDWPTIALCTKEMQHSIASYRDLAFLILDDFAINQTPSSAKFLVFFDSTKASEAATKFIQSHLPSELQEKVKWFHATMLKGFWEETYTEFRNNELFGLCVTDAFRMSLDLPNIELIVQYRLINNMCALWQ